MKPAVQAHEIVLRCLDLETGLVDVHERHECRYPLAAEWVYEASVDSASRFLRDFSVLDCAELVSVEWREGGKIKAAWIGSTRP